MSQLVQHEQLRRFFKVRGVQLKVRNEHKVGVDLNMFERRSYRDEMKNDNLVSFTAVDGESDLWILADINLEKETKEHLKFHRNQMITYAEKNPDFINSLEPLDIDQDAPAIIQHMLRVGHAAQVGPMAAVAGAISEYIGKKLLKISEELIIENGGDIFIKANKPKRIKIYAGNSPFSNQLSMLIQPEQTPLGICTSSGTVGHSLSFGKADAVVVVSKDTLLADAFATSIGNMIKKPEDVQSGLEFAKKQAGILGVIIMIEDQLGIWGEIELCD